MRWCYRGERPPLDPCARPGTGPRTLLTDRSVNDIYARIVILVARPPLSDEAREHGRALGQLLRALRGSRSAAQIASAAGVPLDTLRKLEQGAIAAPGFFLVVRLADALGVTPNDLADQTIRTTI